MNTRGGRIQKISFWKRHKHFKHVVVGLGVVVIAMVALFIVGQIKTAREQSKFSAFYDTSSLPLQGALGEVVRSEPLDVTVDGGTGTRVLYRTQNAGGNMTFSSGMIFVPSAPSTGPRPVVAWAHGTLGMGDKCAPTRTANPVQNLPWVSDMMKNGWIVTATDYAGLGTAGISGYLVGGDEAHDVLNSVRAARNLPGAQAGSAFTIWGHSQGGHSALFAASLATSYAPELQLKGTVAAAPAAEIEQMLSDQDNNILDWAIGPEILTAWPTANPNLPVDELLTPVAKKSYQKIANQCIEAATLGALVRDKLHQAFFAVSPTDSPLWLQEAKAQTAPTLQPDQPLFVIESISDEVIPPQNTAAYIQRACTAGSNVASLWIADTTHMAIPQVVSPTVITWMNDRFANVAARSTCDQKSPV